MGSLWRKLKRTKAREAAKTGVSVGEALAEYVPACPGMPEGFLIGEVIARSTGWEVILHPDIKEYTVRQTGKDETSGFLIRLSFDAAAELAQKWGVLWDPKVDKPPLGSNILCKGAGENPKHWYLPTDSFVNQILDRAEAQFANEATSGGSDNTVS